MENDLEIKITREHYYKESTDQLSYALVNEFATTEEMDKHEYVYTSTIDKNECRICEASSISISELKKIIERVEASGATHIAIDYHCDHDEYDIYGFKIERASEDEIKKVEEIEAIKAKRRNDKKIKTLEDELKKLKGEI